MALEKIVKNSSGVPTGEYERIAGGTLYADNPIGAIVPFGGTDIPAGFLLCNGAEVLKTDYAELYAVIGDAFGTASVNTKFVLPDLRGKTTMGVETGHALGASEVGALPNIKGGDSANVSISHWTDGSAHSNASAFYEGSKRSGFGGTPAGNGEFRNLMFDASRISSIYTNGQNKVDPANVRVNYIIKAKMTAVPADFISAVDDAVEDVYGNIIPSDASASNMLVTENNKGIGKSIPSTSLSSAGWYKICAVSSRNQGTGFTINLGSSYVYATSCMHMINFAYSYINGNMTEIAKDDAGVFDKIRCVYVDNSSKNIILVHYNVSTSNDCYATINCSYRSNALEIFNFEAVDESEYANYIEYDLGTDGAYQNGKLLVTNTVETGSITVGTLPTGISSLSLVYRQQGSICFIRVACVVNVAGEYSIPITLPFTPTEGGAGTKGILAVYDSTNNTEHIGECFINSTHNALTLRTTYATGYNGTLTYLLSS